MARSVFITIATVALLTAAWSIPFARAQQREDNRLGGLSHQPDETEVLQEEQAAGIGLSEGQQKAATNDIEDIYQGLMSGTDGTIPDPEQPADR